MTKTVGKKEKKQDDLLTFIEETAKGKYAEIEQSSLPYVRIEVETEHVDVDEEDYYYSIN
jgi:hypothetical protein